MRVALLSFLSALLLGACPGRGAPSRVRTSHATCEAMCDYYQYCKGDEKEQRYGACISDCRSIFSEDGQMDRDALLQLQRLECPELLSFIEGKGSRPLTKSQESDPGPKRPRPVKRPGPTEL